MANAQETKENRVMKTAEESNPAEVSASSNIEEDGENRETGRLAENHLETSDILLKERKQELENADRKLKRLQEAAQRDKAARVMTKRRVKQVKAAVKKAGSKMSTVLAATKESSAKWFEIAQGKGKTQIIRHKREELLTQLGCEVYDLNSQNITQVLGNESVAAILKQLKKYDAEMRSIEKNLKETVAVPKSKVGRR